MGDVQVFGDKGMLGANVVVEGDFGEGGEVGVGGGLGRGVRIECWMFEGRLNGSEGTVGDARLIDHCRREQWL
jgi:hypothetical protein